MNSFKTVCALLLLVSVAAAQSVPTASKAQSGSSPASVSADEVRELRAALAAQQKQMEEQQKKIEQQQKNLEELAMRLESSETKKSPPNFGEVASTKPIIPAGSISAATPTLPEPSPTAVPAPQTASSEQSPLNIRYKGVTLTPGGFLAAETVWRQHGMAADVNTPFASVPYAGAGNYNLSEFFASGRQSRITMLVEGKIPWGKIGGYYETDWLSAGVTSNNNQSNSYTNRQRQLWAQAALNNGWTFTGGQMWSLVTETGNGMDNRTEKLPSTIDAQYHVGFSWTRQFGFRVTKNFNNKVWLGFSIENPQTLLTAHGNATNFTFGNAGQGGGLYNLNANYSYNVSPDYVFKAVFQPKVGHYEVFGIVSPFRDRIYPNATATPASATGASNSSTTGAGFGANARWLLANKHVEFGLHYLGGNGVGRYGTSTLADLTVRPDGTLETLSAHQGLVTLEFHHKKFDIWSNAGVEHVGRSWALNAAGKPVGYGSPMFSNAGCLVETLPTAGNGFGPGSPASCNGDTRDVQEYSVGFYIKFYNGPMGRLQWGPQYSHIIRNTWAGTGGGPQAAQNMVFTGFRYYLP